MRDITDYLQDILEECNYLIHRSQNLSLTDFAENDDLRRAFVRSLEVIGEAAKKIPKDVRDKHSGLPWRDIAGMRDKLIHGYFGVDYEVVWKTVIEDIPTLKKEIEMVLQSVKAGRD